MSERRVTPEMIKQAGDYVADVFDVGREQGRQTAITIAEIFEVVWDSPTLGTSECSTPQNPSPNPRGGGTSQ